MKFNSIYESTLVKIATLGGVGKIFIAPGTIASLFAITIGCILLFNLNKLVFLCFIVVFFFLGIISIKAHHDKYKNHDSKEVVIDELVGQWIVIMFIDENFLHILLSFILFRFFDILKPWPISLADQKLKNSFGVMFDDILAGLFAGIVLTALINYKIL